MRIFVSYAQKRDDWVHKSLIPMLRASGAEVLVDIDQFKSGQTVIGQMDELQGKAHRDVLVINSDYVTSDYCRHEIKQAIGTDSDFAASKVITIHLDATPMPAELSGKGGLCAGPLCVDPQDDDRSGADCLDGSMLEEVGRRSIISGDTVLRQLVHGECKTDAERAYIAGFRETATQAPPTDAATPHQSLRHRQIITEEENSWRLKAPLMQQWLTTRA